MRGGGTILRFAGLHWSPQVRTRAQEFCNASLFHCCCACARSTYGGVEIQRSLLCFVTPRIDELVLFSCCFCYSASLFIASRSERKHCPLGSELSDRAGLDWTHRTARCPVHTLAGRAGRVAARVAWSAAHEPRPRVQSPPQVQVHASSGGQSVVSKV